PEPDTYHYSIYPRLKILEMAASGLGFTSPTGSQDYIMGTQVVITATPAIGNVFGGWTGDPDCADGHVTMIANRNCIANFFPIPLFISTKVTPEAGGSLVCAPNPVFYGGTSECKAVPNPGYVLNSESELNYHDGVLTLTNVTTNMTVAANFTQMRRLTLEIDGSGAGEIFTADRNAVYAHGLETELVAKAGEDSIFDGWSGDPDCVDGQVTMDQDKVCIATFTRIYPVAIEIVPPDAGTVTCDPEFIRHGTDGVCTATAEPGYKFAEFSGDCTGNSCQLQNVTGVKRVIATFVHPNVLTVLKTGDGTGAVRSTAADVDCGDVCTKAYPNSELVTLTATPDTGSAFVGWDGDCTGIGTCSVTMDATREVTAIFSKKCNKAVDIMLVLDSSGSIGASNFAYVKDFARSILGVLDVHTGGPQLGITQFSSQDRGKIEIGLTADSAAIATAIDNIVYQAGNTDIQEGIALSQQELITKGRPNVARALILFTDGTQYPDGTGSPALEAANARKQGTEIFAVGVGKANPKQLQDIASAPYSKHILNTAQFSDMIVLINDLVNGVCEPTLDKIPEPAPEAVTP
ncbi:hypothetical protein TI04_03085, partial [Achromatium sp. WMS2]